MIDKNLISKFWDSNKNCEDIDFLQKVVLKRYGGSVTGTIHGELLFIITKENGMITSVHTVLTENY